MSLARPHPAKTSLPPQYLKSWTTKAQPVSGSSNFKQIHKQILELYEVNVKIHYTTITFLAIINIKQRSRTASRKKIVVLNALYYVIITHKQILWNIKSIKFNIFPLTYNGKKKLISPSCNMSAHLILVTAGLYTANRKVSQGRPKSHVEWPLKACHETRQNNNNTTLIL